MPRRTLLSSEQRVPAVLYPNRCRRNGPALCPQRRRPDPDPDEAAGGQSSGLRCPTLRTPLSWPRHRSGGIATRADACLCRKAAWYRSGIVRRVRPPGGNPPRAYDRTSEASAPPQFRVCRLAILSEGRRGCRLGDRPRGADRPGHDRPFAGEQRAPARGDGVGTDRAWRLGRAPGRRSSKSWRTV